MDDHVFHGHLPSVYIFTLVQRGATVGRGLHPTISYRCPDGYAQLHLHEDRRLRHVVWRLLYRLDGEFFCFCFVFFNKLLFILENSQVHLVFIVPPVGFDLKIQYK